jgi:hypothetical protein
MASTTFLTSTRPSELWPGIKGFWDGAEKEFTTLYNKYFDVTTSDKKQEQYSEHYNTGLVPIKAESDETVFAGFAQGAQPRFTNVAYSLGIILSHESIKDNQYFKEGKDKVKALRKSFYTTKEIVHANVLNNGFNSSFLQEGGDGVELFSQLHLNASGTYQNELTLPADLSESSLEDMLILIKGAFDSTGVHKANLTPKMLIVPDALCFTAERILRSILQNDTGNNAINAIKNMGLLPDGYLVNTYLTDNDAWFVKTDAEGLLSLERESLELYDDNDTKTRNMQYFGYERYSKGWKDPRGIYGSEGA